MPKSRFHQLTVIQWDNSPTYLWLHNDMSDNTDTVTIRHLQSMIKSSPAPVVLSESTSVLFNGKLFLVKNEKRVPKINIADDATEYLSPYGPYFTKLGHGGFGLRKLQTHPSPVIGKEAEFLNFYRLPHLGVQLKPKQHLGRIVLGSQTRKDSAKLFFFTYEIGKQEGNSAEGTKTPVLDDKDIWKLGPTSTNASSVPLKIAPLDPDAGDLNPLLPFSCKEEGCGPDVRCQDAPSRQCFLYNSEFLCCRQSPFS